MILFLALLFLALAIAGATAFVIFWPLMMTHSDIRAGVARPSRLRSPIAR